MYKRSIFTTITPLPSYITRETVVETLHNHKEMIELNPLVINFTRCRPAPYAPADEFHCIWYELTDRISYLPGGLIRGNISYKACFYDLPRGLQTHVYAPTNLDIRDKWSVCGNMPGEPREPVELGLTDAPREGLYLREDVDMRCQIWSTSFVKKTLKRAHAMLVDRLVMKADLLKTQSEPSWPKQQHELIGSLISPGSEVAAPRYSTYSSRGDSKQDFSNYPPYRSAQTERSERRQTWELPEIRINDVPEHKVPETESGMSAYRLANGASTASPDQPLHELAG